MEDFDRHASTGKGKGSNLSEGLTFNAWRQLRVASHMGDEKVPDSGIALGVLGHDDIQMVPSSALIETHVGMNHVLIRPQHGRRLVE